MLLSSSLDSSTDGKQTHRWNSNPLHLQLLTLSQIPVEQISPRQQGTCPSEKPPLLPNGFKSSLGEGKVPLTPETVNRCYLQSGVRGAGLLGSGSGSGGHCHAPAEGRSTNRSPSRCFYFGDSV